MKQLLRSTIFMILIANAITRSVIPMNKTDEEYKMKTTLTDNHIQKYTLQFRGSFVTACYILYSITLISGFFLFCYKLCREFLFIRRICASSRNLCHRLIIWFSCTHNDTHDRIEAHDRIQRGQVYKPLMPGDTSIQIEFEK